MLVLVKSMHEIQSERGVGVGVGDIDDPGTSRNVFPLFDICKTQNLSVSIYAMLLVQK